MTFGPDDVEKKVPDLETAAAMLDERDARFVALIHDFLSPLRTSAPEEDLAFFMHTESTLKIAYARFATRHGSWGDDRHAYHNEFHVWEIIHDRIGALRDVVGLDALTPRGWALLAMFAASHDLRQRETSEEDTLIGPNEKASIAEMQRILELAGFDLSDARDAEIAQDLSLMIAGSTFETAADSDHVMLPSGGAVAPALVNQLRAENADWESNDSLRRRIRMTLIASDLDTANVAEPFPTFARSAARLGAEVEMRCGRPLLDETSAQSMLKFLTDGQEYYFFQLHHFDSKLGRRVFTSAKEVNAPKVLALSQYIRERFQHSTSVTGEEIAKTFIERADELG